MVEVIHAGAAECAVGGRKTSRLDDMGLDAEAGAQTQDRTGVLGDIWLEQGDTHGGPWGDAARTPCRRKTLLDRGYV